MTALTLTAIQRRCGNWHHATFGRPARPSTSGVKLAEEVAELNQAITANFLPDIEEEAADIMIVLLCLCAAFQLDLARAVEQKLAHNEERAAAGQWRKET